jgi:catechol 2,3-dioxygenase-like lactoylglutathione lyase family enzyme
VVPSRVTVLTIGARDVSALRAFYERLGWRVAIEMEEFGAFETRGVVVALYDIALLGRDSTLPLAPAGPAISGFNPAVNVDEVEQVDEVVEAARAAGAKIVREPHTAEWGGRTAYFTDPEDNLWEVAWIPQDSNMAELIRKAAGG